tara:strand:+ start:830 stop:1480 length:651 start_codon:yes stop_codon:yes gene_type:complete
MTDFEKVIYNTFLRTKRTEQDKPYRARKNFDKFDDGPDYPYVKRLGMFFRKFSHITLDTFFRAPYRVYPDGIEQYDIKFYTSPRATKLYGIYVEQLDSENPDSDHHIQFIKDSLLFMFKFCRDEKLTFEQYTEHMTGDILTPLLHIRDKHVSPYAIFGIKDLGDIVHRYPSDFLDFIAGKNFAERVDLYRSRYYNSRKAKTITVRGIHKLTKILTN